MIIVLISSRSTLTPCAQVDERFNYLLIMNDLSCMGKNMKDMIMHMTPIDCMSLQGCVSFLLDSLLDTPCTDNPPQTSGTQLPGIGRTAVLLTCSEVTDLVRIQKQISHEQDAAIQILKAPSHWHFPKFGAFRKCEKIQAVQKSTRDFYAKSIISCEE